MQWVIGPASDIDEIISNVITAYNNYDPHTLDHVWISHQAGLNEIMACNGGYHYKPSHLGKHSLMNANGIMPCSIKVFGRSQTDARALTNF